jgi:hypothetical protein
MSVESLKVFFDFAAVILLFLTFVAGAGVLITGNIVNERQTQQLRQFDQNLTASKTELSRQEERTAKAELEQEKLKSANLELEERIAQQGHRSLQLLSSQDQFLTPLKQFSGQRFEIGFCSILDRDWEVSELRLVLWGNLKLAGWVPNDERSIGMCSTGILVYVWSTAPAPTRKAADALSKSLNATLGKYNVGKAKAGQVGGVLISEPKPPAVNAVEPSTPDTILVLIGGHS